MVTHRSASKTASPIHEGFVPIFHEDTRSSQRVQETGIWEDAQAVTNTNPSGRLRVKLRRVPTADDLPLPAYQTQGAAGMDLYAAVEDSITLKAGERVSVPTGIAISIPEGYEGQVRPRSGLARRHGIGMVNSPGTIDSDYTGEIQVLLINLGSEPFTIHRADRIAQLIIAPVMRVVWEETDNLEKTERGAGGFGHTGGLALNPEVLQNIG